MKVFGERLRELRKRQNMTQEDLCNANIFLDNKGRPVTKQTISYYESGRYEPSFEGLVSAAKYFNVKPEYLLGCSEFVSSQHEEISKKKILSDNAIKSLLSLPDSTVKAIELLIPTPWFIYLVGIFKYYSELSLSDNENELFKKIIANSTVSPVSFNIREVMKQVIQSELNDACKKIMEYLDGLKNTKKESE